MNKKDFQRNKLSFLYPLIIIIIMIIWNILKNQITICNWTNFCKIISDIIIFLLILVLFIGGGIFPLITKELYFDNYYKTVKKTKNPFRYWSSIVIIWFVFIATIILLIKHYI